MKKIIVFILAIFLVLGGIALARVYTRGATALIGGTTGTLDSYDGTDLQTGDRATVVTATSVFQYYMDASSGATESSPEVISPDTNAGDKRWLKVGVVTRVSINNVTNPPTEAEIITAFGTAATVGKGFIGIINDNNAGTHEYLCWSDGVNWFFVTGTKAL